MEPGSRLGPFRLAALLGSGGMGTVFDATLEEPVPGRGVGERVAVKVLHPHIAGSDELTERFVREAHIGMALRHPNVVRTFDCRRIDGLPVLTMEFVGGQTLRSLLDDLERVPEALCRHIGREIASALAAIHGNGVVHRDVKPENVLITPDHTVKVMDLGVARVLDASVELTRTGAFIGSIKYTAPESLSRQAGAPDHRVDLHALGIVLYELASGVHPFAADTVHGVMHRVLSSDPVRLGRLEPQLSRFFEELVHALLAKQPGDRPASASALASWLREGESSTWWQRRSAAMRASTQRPLRRVRIPRETGLHGRAAEIERLQSAYARARGAEAQVLLIRGEAGIGKSRLVDEFVALLHEAGEDLEFLHGSYPPGGAANFAGACSEALLERFGPDGSRAFLPATPVLVPAFDAFLRGESPPPETEPLTREALRTCFVESVRSLAAARPTIVLIEDLHFATDEGRALFGVLAHAAPGHRVLLIGTARPELPERWRAELLGLDHAAGLELDRIAREPLGRLLAEALRSDSLAERIGPRLAEKSGGNPFFAFEIVSGLRDAGHIRETEDGSWIATDALDQVSIPSSVLELVTARVAALDESERHVLDVAACCGYTFDPRLLGDVLDRARIPLLTQLSQIERRHRLVRSVGRRFRFDHHQVQEALYARLPELLREELHGAIGDALALRAEAAGDAADVVETCHHLLRGARWESAARWLDPALDVLASDSQASRSLDLAERALAAPAIRVGAARLDLLQRCAQWLRHTGDTQRREQIADEAASLAEKLGDARSAVIAADLRVAVCCSAGRYEEGERALTHGLAIARDAQDLGLEARLLAHASLYEAIGRPQEALAMADRLREVAAALGDPRIGGTAATRLGLTLTMLGRLDEARAQLELALAFARQNDHRVAEAAALINVAVVPMQKGRTEEAISYYERGARIARSVGHRFWSGNAQQCLSVARMRLGHAGVALESQRATVDLWREQGVTASRQHAAALLGLFLVDLGALTDAGLRFASLAAEAGAQIGYLGAVIDLGRARIAAWRDAADAESKLRATRATWEAMDVKRHVVDMHVDLGGHLRRTGRASDAAREYEQGAVAAAEADYTEGAMLCRTGLAAACRDAPDALGRIADADQRVRENTPLLAAMVRLQAAFDLWEATAAPARLEEAWRLLRAWIPHLPEENVDGFLRNVPHNRLLAEAARRAGLDGA